MFTKKNDAAAARYYWAYGSNLNVAQMRLRCPRAEKIGRLYGRCVRLAFRGGADVDIVVGKPDVICPGGLWKITPECEQQLDRWEGVVKGTYSKWFFEAEVRGKLESVLFYKKNSNGLLVPREEYYRTILRGYKDFNLDVKHLRKARERAVRYNSKGDKKVKLFVYGTLKRKECNNRLLEGATYLGNAVTEDCYFMSSHAFPMIWDFPQGRVVRGEIYSINEKILKDCDTLEGHPNFYKRSLRQAVTDDGQKHEAWIYVTQRETYPGNEVEPNEHGELEWNMERSDA